MKRTTSHKDSTIKLSCQANLTLRVYTLSYLKNGTKIGAGTGAVAGVGGGIVAGTFAGIGVGAAIGTVAIPVPILGTLIGVAAGVAAGLGTMVVGTGVGAGIGAGVGSAVTCDKPKIITAKEVFEIMPGKCSKCDETNRVHCEISLPSQDETYEEVFETFV